MRSRKGGGPVKPPGQAVQATGWNTLLCVAAILLTGWIAYSNTFDCPFQFDDRTSITENEMIRSFDPVAIWNYNKYRFLPYLSFAWNYSIHQYEPGGYHLLNLLIHLINAVVVFSIVRALFETPRLKSHPLFHQRDSIALLSALLFVAHPLATQAVTYIVQRMASMAALFYFLSLWFYLRGRLSKGRAQILFFTGTLVSVLCAYPLLRDRKGAYMFMDTYIFMVSTEGVELFNAGMPSLEGKNIIDLKDLKGNNLVKDEIALALKQGKGWIDGYWYKPGDNRPALKRTFVKEVKCDGTTCIIGSGYYPE